MKRALVTLLVLSAAAIFVACGDSAVGKATGVEDRDRDMAVLRAESAAQQNANTKTFDKMMADAAAERKAEDDANARAFDKKLTDRDAERKAEDDEEDKKRAESDAETKRERETWRQGVKESEAKAGAEREARFKDMMSAALKAQADQQKAEQERAEKEKADEEEKEKADPKKAGQGTAEEETAPAGPTEAEYEAALLFLHDVFDERYPTAKAVLNKDRGAAALKKYNVDVTSGESVLSDVTLTLHEDGHALDGALKREGGRENYFLVAQLMDGTILDFAPPGLTYPNSSDYFEGISRSAILLDSQNHKRPPADCPNCILNPHQEEGEWGSDGSYSSLYLTDAPEAGVITHYKEGFPGFDPNFTVATNDNFDSGDQGYGMLFEETLQYSRSLSWKYNVDDIEKTRGSGKDSMLLWLWWNERYLKLVREEYPAEHEFFMEHWAEAFLTVWGQAWRHLDTPSMLYNPDKYDDLLELVTDDLMLGEVQYVRELYHGADYKRGTELAASTLNTDPDGATWDGPTLSGAPLIVDSKAVDGIYFATMPEGFTEVDENRQGLADISTYIDKYNAQLSVADGGYGNTADNAESSEADLLK